jgi:hypothetical protein
VQKIPDLYHPNGQVPPSNWQGKYGATYSRTSDPGTEPPILKHVYDWTWHGMNEAKPSPIPLPCKQCNKPDGQAHMILHCPHPNMIAIRQETLQYLHETTMEVIDNAEPYLGSAATIFERLI